ncbi:heavy metal-associated domain-containing protein [Streptomyces sp. P9(2023)]|uniref:heavy-metal-associated domain-containing protein n=1 Tax=Streptomyces sp. P9(2023) TaxID=3064394 RepID=UPI0028F401CB|nr:heavy metal-associated domain-containing protein [Streptomyces sp. P9(2023)]MDT9691268.1 heavy metal-associated domain-containing protein [Streptomyces sp. P9(2023)]
MTLRLEFAVAGMHCSSCGLLIDDEIEELPGVTASTTDVRTERTVVELDHPVPAERIIEAIATAGYTAVPAA